MIRFFRILDKNALEREKKKDYRNIVVMQVIIISSGMILSPFMNDVSFLSKLIISIFSGFGVIYSFLLWDLLRNFTNNQLLLKSFFMVLVIIVIAGLLVEFPFYHVIPVTDRRLFLLFIHGCLFPIEVTIITYCIRDIFTGDHLSMDKLWGAACIYLMIGISFGSLYDLINIYSPESFGESIPLGLPSYSEAVYYSFSTLTGIDNIYSHAIRLMRNIGIIEAIWGNLFVVLIVGRLLTLPRVESK